MCAGSAPDLTFLNLPRKHTQNPCLTACLKLHLCRLPRLTKALPHLLWTPLGTKARSKRKHIELEPRTYQASSRSPRRHVTSCPSATSSDSEGASSSVEEDSPPNLPTPDPTAISIRGLQGILTIYNETGKGTQIISCSATPC